MEIIKLKINELKPYDKNAKIHTKEQVEQIKKSIEEFGMNDPIAVWGKDNLIVEGHGRLEALKELGYDEVECIRLDHLTDEERKAYTLVHNKLTMNTDFDFELLNGELVELSDSFDMTEFGFLENSIDLDEVEEEGDNPYTTKINIPQYEIKGEEPEISELCDDNKTEELIKEIEKANITKEQKEFLIKSAQRHLGFNYSKIAEYYAHQNKEMQELMEKSALVIIDYDDAIKNGYAELKKEIDLISENEEDEEYDED